MEKLESLQEIVDYLVGLPQTKGGKVQLARIYGMAQAQAEVIERKREIEKVLNLSPGSYVLEVTFVGDEMAVAEVEVRGVGKLFYSVVRGKRLSEVSHTFDQALLVSLAEKYGVSSYAVPAMYQILQMYREDSANKGNHRGGE